LTVGEGENVVSPKKSAGSGPLGVFSDFGDKIRDALEKKGFTAPTKIQEKAIPLVSEGRHSLIIAPTGEGKTEVALLPILDRMMSEGKTKPISVLYIAPLRALNRDLLDRIEWWSMEFGFRVEVRHGDTSARQRRKQALRPPDVLITTPETLQAILPGSTMRKHLANVKHVVVDEVHELAEDKRGVQLSLALERLAAIAGEFQRIGLSATVGSPEDVAQFLGGSRNVDICKVDFLGNASISVEYPRPTDADSSTAKRLMIARSSASRLRRIRELVDSHTSTLVFVNTRDMAEILSSRFNLWDREVGVDVHHSSLSSGVRIDTEKRFKSEEIKGIICTSSMELGIDVGSVDLVIQYESPRQAARLIQRVGRSGHRTGLNSKGVVITVNPDDVIESMVVARRTKDEEIERTQIPEESLDVLGHQITGLCLEYRDLEVSDVLSLARRAYPYSDLSAENLMRVVRQLQDQSILWVDGTKMRRRRAAWQYYYENLSTIPDVKRFNIINVVTNQRIGTLDEEFVATKAHRGTTFITKGEAWHILDIDEDKVMVSPAESPMGAIPGWVGEMIPVPYDVAQEVGMIRERLSGDFDADELKLRYHIGDSELSLAQEYVRSQAKASVVPTHDRIVLEAFRDRVVFHGCFGTKTNETIARIIASLLTARFGAAVGVRVDPYRMVFTFPDGGGKPDLIIQTIEDLDIEHVIPILEIVMKRTSMFKWRLVHVAKRFGAMRRDVDYQRISLNRLAMVYEGTPLYDETLNELMLDKLNAEGACRVLQSIKSGDLKYEIVKTDKVSPFSAPILKREGFSDVITPENPDKEIMAVLKRRLMKRRVKLLCMNCLSSVKRRIEEIEESPKCWKCGSKVIAALRPGDKETEKALERRDSDTRLTSAQRDLVERASLSAGLVSEYGRRAAMTMAARGIGPQTAARILAKLHRSEDDLLRDILTQEKQYVRTRRFWD
jgi:ATP-dependent Lhr-like helicase